MISMCIYRPLMAAGDVLLEDEATYLGRVGSLLPNFPHDVLLQWFFEHWQDIRVHDWLEYSTLVFDRKRWSTVEIPRSNFGHEEAIEGYRQYMKTSTELSERRARLLGFMREKGTWPRPIIVLDTSHTPTNSPSWVSSGPFHLIEGHNRTAAMRLLLEEKAALQVEHDVWIVSRAVAS